MIDQFHGQVLRLSANLTRIRGNLSVYEFLLKYFHGVSREKQQGFISQLTQEYWRSQRLL